MNPNFQRIIGLGKSSLPFLFKKLELEAEPTICFDALTAITGNNPITENIAGNIMEMRRVWLTWGKKQGYL